MVCLLGRGLSPSSQPRITTFALTSALPSDFTYIPLGDTQILLKKYQDAENNFQAAINHGLVHGYAKIGAMWHLGLGRQIDNLKALRFYYSARDKGAPNMDRRILSLERHLNLDELTQAKKLKLKWLVNDDLGRTALAF